MGVTARWVYSEVSHSHTVTQSHSHTVTGVTVSITQTRARVWSPHSCPGPTMTPTTAVLLLLVASSHSRPQTVHPAPPSDRARVLTEFDPAPNCDSIFRRSLPECQQKS